MIGIVVATHGKMAEGIVDAAKLIIGSVDNTEVISLVQDDNIDQFGKDLLGKIKEVDNGEGVIIFTDIQSASPYNQSVLAISKLPKDQQKDKYVIPSVNLPMFIEAVNNQLIGTEFEEAVSAIIDQGNQSVDSWSIDQLSEEVDDDDDF